MNGRVTLTPTVLLVLKQINYFPELAGQIRGTNESEFLFYVLALSLRNFTGSHRIVPVYIDMFFLMDTNVEAMEKE